MIKMSANQKNKLTFEENLKNLEKNVKALEENELPLKETLEKFEEGIRLSKLLTEELETAEKRIKKIFEKDGKVVEEEFRESD